MRAKKMTPGRLMLALFLLPVFLILCWQEQTFNL